MIKECYVLVWILFIASSAESDFDKVLLRPERHLLCSHRTQAKHTSLVFASMASPCRTSLNLLVALDRAVCMQRFCTAIRSQSGSHVDTIAIRWRSLSSIHALMGMLHIPVTTRIPLVLVAMGFHRVYWLIELVVSLLLSLLLALIALLLLGRRPWRLTPTDQPKNAQCSLRAKKPHHRCTCTHKHNHKLCIELKQ